MPVIIERYDSRESTVGVDNPSVDLIYVVDGTESDAVVRGLVEATIPAMYAGLVFQNYHIAHQGGGLWEVTVRYGKREPKEPGESSFSFDTGGGTTHITQSLQTVARYPWDAPDFKGAIGVHNDFVDGTDITIPVYNFKETHYTQPSSSRPPTRRPSSPSPARSMPSRSKASPQARCSSWALPAPNAAWKIGRSPSASPPAPTPSA
jgi:hypothetical protein